ncbi:nitroreductase family protein [Sphingomonas colocasiae]|uniref:Nitroreductase family protein n=1 Tax=Sphingomonas colocasiae TaxID=1848973 RepID=A0ABS7PKC2_9SPHN|nr:nitroreductase family protein [Sphingomonas colocasiae]MBY8821205.1 nitroreductase family protein [Sphingomonas colocasiae]
MTGSARKADHPIEPFFLERWSPRSFSGEPVPDTVLQSAFEAARWAPSAFNAQPWRFLFARPGDQTWTDYLSFLNPRNGLWANRASALIVIVSARQAERDGKPVAIASHGFDTGAAWANFAHQALLLGWHTHGIGGFDRDAARERLGIPDDHDVLAMIALGRRTDPQDLHEDFRAAERPNGRKPITETIFSGRFGAPAFPERRNAA